MIDIFRRAWLSVTMAHKLSRFIDRKKSSALGRGSEWIYLRYASVYVRYSPIYLDDMQVRSAITIASVEVRHKYQRRGFFKVIFHVVEQTALARRMGATSVENVNNPELYRYLLRRKYRSSKLNPETLYKETFHS